jgi:DNA repair protein RadC
MPSGKIIKIQGYEHHAINKLLNENINENDIIIGSKNVPEIWYYDSCKNKKRRHFVDIYLSGKNKCIEVKSTWTFNINKDIVFSKQQAAKDLGYLYEIWVYDKDGNKLQIYD